MAKGKTLVQKELPGFASREVLREIVSALDSYIHLSEAEQVALVDQVNAKLKDTGYSVRRENTKKYRVISQLR